MEDPGGFVAIAIAVVGTVIVTEAETAALAAEVAVIVTLRSAAGVAAGAV